MGNDHFATFKDIWQGGYFEGDPLNPMGESKYRRLGYISILHALYLQCVKPHINGNTVALEIGPGRGAWTKTMLDSKEIWCLDAKSREENQIDEYLGWPKNLKYHQVTDFKCNALPDDTFTYMFSFGCLCHVPWEGVCEYAKNLFPKLKSGANCYWMISDYDKRNNVAENFNQYDIVSRILKGRWYSLFNRLNDIFSNKILGPGPDPILCKENDLQTGNGRWYHGGKERTVEMLENIGYMVIEKDVGIVSRDVVIHFQKP